MGLDTDEATGQPSCSEYVFTASSHAAALLSSMKELRDHCNLCDVTLCVGEEEFKAHRLVLAACSPYFSAMFNNKHLESSLTCVELNGVDAGAIKCLIEFAYSSSLTLSQGNVQAVLAAANLLQMMSVVEACCDYLLGQICADNCLGIAAFAEMLSCTELRQVSWQYALDNFHDVWHTEEFLLTPVNILEELMRSENLHVHSEEEALDSVLRWYRHDELNRLSLVGKILNHVKLPLIPWAILSNRILDDITLSSDSECQILLENAKSFQSSPKVAECLVNSPEYTQYIPRKYVRQNLFLYVVGGETTPGRSTVGSVEQFDPAKNTWNTLEPMKTARRGVGICFMNGLVYVVGGSDGVKALRMVECYDPHLNTWTQLADMTQERSSVAAACLGNNLYAVGGYDGIMSCLNSVERYDPIVNTWTSTTEMTTPRSMHAVAVLNQLLYVVGGYDGTSDLASCEVYNAESDQWEVLESMTSPRCMPAVGVLEGSLFVVGGCDCSQSLSSVEVYNQEKRQWELVADMNEPRSGFGVGVIGRKMYALGGYMDSASGYSSTVECYDIGRNNWTLVANMKTERRRFGCCS